MVSFLQRALQPSFSGSHLLFIFLFYFKSNLQSSEFPYRVFIHISSWLIQHLLSLCPFSHFFLFSSSIFLFHFSTAILCSKSSCQELRCAGKYSLLSLWHRLSDSQQRVQVSFIMDTNYTISETTENGKEAFKCYHLFFCPFFLFAMNFFRKKII